MGPRATPEEGCLSSGLSVNLFFPGLCVSGIIISSYFSQHLHVQLSNLFYISCIIIIFFSFLGREHARMHAHEGRWGEGEGERDSQADPMLSAEPDGGIRLITLRS